MYVRIENADINGKRRDLTDPDAHVFLSDGRIENPNYLIKVFKGSKKVFEKHIKAGEMAVFPGGSVRLSNNVLLWVEIQAQRNPWLIFVTTGLFAIIISVLLSVLSVSIRIYRRISPVK